MPQARYTVMIIKQKTFLLWFFLICVTGLAPLKSVSAQYRLPLNFNQSDSMHIKGDLKNFANHFGVHFGDIPGTVFQRGMEYPRIQFYYGQGAAYTLNQNKYNNKSSGAITSTGMFTLLGDLTSNMQLILRYNPMSLDDKASVLNGYGARYRPSVGTDSLHSLSLGVMIQKLASSGYYAKTVDFSLGYNWFFQRWTIHLDASTSFVNGHFDLKEIPAIGENVSTDFEQRVIHLGIGAQYQWRNVTFGARIRSNGFIWSGIMQLGWSIPSKN